MAAHKDNKYATKLKTLELKRLAYDQYCEHLATGKAKKSWYFDHPEIMITWQTMEKYIANEPEVFNPIHKEIAWAKGYQKWEQIVSDSAIGANKDANTATLQMVMRNKYHWDREESNEKDDAQSLLQALATRWREE